MINRVLQLFALNRKVRTMGIEGWIDTTEAARRMNLSRGMVLVYCRRYIRGKDSPLIARKIGRDYLILESSLEGFEKSNRGQYPRKDN